MALTLVTEPTENPITIDEGKLHLKLDDETADDSLVEGLIDACVEQAEAFLGRALCSQTWDLVLDGFPANHIELSLPPLQSVTSIKYRDTANAEQTLSATYYSVLTPTNAKGYVELNYGYSWPTVYSRSDAVTIRYVCGYGTAAAVPQSVKSAMLIMLDDLYANRGALVLSGVNVQNLKTAETLMWPYRVIEF